MSDEVAGWVPVETVGGTRLMRYDHGAVNLSGFWGEYLTPAMWAAFTAAGDRLLAGARGRKVLELAREAGAPVLFTLAADVEDCLGQTAGLDDLTDRDWARIAGALREHEPGEPLALLKDLWKQAGEELNRDAAA